LVSAPVRLTPYISAAAKAFRLSHHESIRPLVPELGSLPEVVQDAGLVDVVQRRHVRYDLRVRRKRLSEALWARASGGCMSPGRVTVSVQHNEPRGVSEGGGAG